MSLRKLIKLERTINIYDNANDELLEEISVDIVPFDRLILIVLPNEEDPLLYDGYDLNLEQLEQFNSFLPEKIKVDIVKYSYILVCGGVYE